MLVLVTFFYQFLGSVNPPLDLIIEKFETCLQITIVCFGLCFDVSNEGQETALLMIEKVIQNHQKKFSHVVLFLTSPGVGADVNFDMTV